MGVPTSGKPLRPDSLAEDVHRSQYYAAFVTLTVHGQENKWWILYIYLMFNSILILACVGLFVATDYRLVHKLALSVLCGAGLFVGMCWIAMAVDYVAASSSLARSPGRQRAECLRDYGAR